MTALVRVAPRVCVAVVVRRSSFRTGDGTDTYHDRHGPDRVGCAPVLMASYCISPANARPPVCHSRLRRHGRGGAGESRSPPIRWHWRLKSWAGAARFGVCSGLSALVAFGTLAWVLAALRRRHQGINVRSAAHPCAWPICLLIGSGMCFPVRCAAFGWALSQMCSIQTRPVSGRPVC